MIIPGIVRTVFESFPVKVLPALPIAETVSSAAKPVLYVRGVDETSGLSLEPACLEAQLHLKLLRQDFYLEQVASSASSAMPVLFDSISNEIHASSRQVITSLRGSISGQDDIIRTIVVTSLRDAWLAALVDSRFDSVRMKVYGCTQRLPSAVSSVVASELVYQLLLELEPRYPEMVESASAYGSFFTLKGRSAVMSKSCAAINSRAAEALRILEESVPDVEVNSPAAVAIAAYIYCIITYIPESQLGQAVASHPQLISLATQQLASSNI